MFLRRYERRRNGKGHTYWALVESRRTGRGSRQRIVAYLGELKTSEKSGWAQLGRRLSKKERPEPSLFDPPHYDEPEDDESVLVRLSGVTMERLRDFGGWHYTAISCRDRQGHPENTRLTSTTASKICENRSDFRSTVEVGLTPTDRESLELRA